MKAIPLLPNNDRDNLHKMIFDTIVNEKLKFYRQLSKEITEYKKSGKIPNDIKLSLKI